jgi:type VI protein secretion system component VasF
VYRQICAQRGVPERSYAVAMEPLTPATAPSIIRVPYLKLMGILCAALFVVYVALDVILQFKAADVKEGLRTVVVDNSVIDQAGIRQDK